MPERGGYIMSTIFPREEKAEQIFDKILDKSECLRAAEEHIL